MASLLNPAQPSGAPSPLRVILNHYAGMLAMAALLNPAQPSGAPSPSE